MKTWIGQHLTACCSAAKQIVKAPGNFLFNVIVVAVALALPITGLTLIENSRPVSTQLAIEPELSVFLKAEVSRAEALALTSIIKKMLKNNQTPAKVVFVPRETALTALQDRSGLGDVLTTLGDNPLPDAYVLSFEQHLFKEGFKLSAVQSTPTQINHLAKELQQLPEVDHVQIDSDWIKRLAALMNLAQFILIVLALTLSIVVITVVFNATRLQVLSHRAEIAVFRLLGATNQYIRRPYYYAGAFLGLAAGLAALALVAIGLHPLNQAIVEFASLYGSEFQLNPLNFTFSAYSLILSVLLGLFGAFLSVRRQTH